MTEQTYTYRDSTLNFNEAGNYTLLLQVNTQGFDYAVVDHGTLVACETNCKLEELTKPDQLFAQLNAEYKNTVIGLPAKGFTLIPTELFDVDHIADIAKILDVKDGENVLAQVLDTDNYIIYKVDERLIASVTSLDIKNIVFAAKGWLAAIERSSPSNGHLFLNFDNGQVEIAYYKGNKLRFYNKFEFANIEELVYFTLLVSNELELKQQNTTLIVSGNITTGDLKYTTLAQYYSNVRLNTIEVAELPGDIRSHQLLPLFALYLCAL
jgi:hypothetical protein